MTPEAQVIDITPTTEVETKALAIPEKARLIVVSDNDSMTMADNTKAAIKDMIKEIDSVFKPMADKAFQAHRAITGKWKAVVQPLKDADEYLTGQVKGYLRKLEEIRQAEERRLREEARKAEEERRLQEALLAEQEGNEEEAQAILEEEIYVPPPVVKVEAPKVDNRKYRTIPRCRCIDKMKLIRFVAQNPALADLLDYNSSVGNNKAKSMGKEINNIPGLSYYEE
jgi:hypothetical protein